MTNQKPDFTSVKIVGKFNTVELENPPKDLNDLQWNLHEHFRDLKEAHQQIKEATDAGDLDKLAELADRLDHLEAVANTLMIYYGVFEKQVR